MTGAFRCLPLIAALAVWALAFVGEFGQLFQRWSDDDYQHCMLVPLIFAYVLWQEEGPEGICGPLARRGNLLGVVLVGAACALYVIGKAGGLLLLVYAAMYLTLVGLFIILRGTSFVWRNAWAFVLLLFAIPGTNIITHTLTLYLRLTSTAIAGALLPFVGLPVIVEGNILDLGSATLEVANACSGLRYFFPIVFLAFFMSYLFKLRWYAALVLGVLAIPISIVANAVRLIVMAFIAVYGGTHLLDTWLHEATGVLLYAVALGLLLAAALALRKLPPPREEPMAPFASLRPASAAAMLLAGSLMLSASVAWALHMAAAAPVALRAAPASLATQAGGFSMTRQIVLNEETLNVLGADEYLNRNYRDGQTAADLYFLMTYYSHQSLDHAVHPPASCQLGSGYSIAATGVGSLSIPGQPPLPYEWTLLEKGSGQVLANHYYFGPQGEMIGAFGQRMSVLLRNLKGQGTNGGLVRVEIQVPDGQNVKQAQSVLTRFFQAFVPGIRALTAQQHAPQGSQ